MRVPRTCVRVRASRKRYICVYLCDSDEGRKSRRKKKTSASWGVVAERVAALHPGCSGRRVEERREMPKSRGLPANGKKRDGTRANEREIVDG